MNTFKITLPGVFFIMAVCAAPVACATQAENFPRPAELEHDVQFWIKVYTQIDTGRGYLHDAENLTVIYDTVNIEGRAGAAKTRRAKAYYKTILKTLAAGKRAGLSRDEKRVLAVWGADVSRQRLQQAAGRIRLQRGQSNRFKAGIKRSGEWRAYIDQTFKDFGMPPQLSVLPHVESSFNPNAYSHVGAAGMWQFIRSTGRRYMQIDYLVDERMDPFAATVAAARLLQHNYSVTKSWPLALTAYNHGVASMRRAMHKLGTSDIAAIVRNYKGRAFGFASRNFYVAFLAALEVDANAEKYFGTIKKHQPFDYQLVTMADYVFAKDIADHFQISESQLKRHNRSLLSAIWNGTKRIPKGFQLRIPESLLTDSARTLMASLPAEKRFSEQTPDLFHIVARGDTISEIAARYGFKMRAVMLANNMRSGHYIRIGQKLRLPVKDNTGITVLASAGQTMAVKPAAVQAEPPARLEAVAKSSLQHGGMVVAKTGTTGPPAQAPALRNHSEKQAKSDIDVTAVAQVSHAVASDAALLTDPADYTVAADNTIEVQSAETLGHYAEWLDVRASRLRAINRLRFGKPVVVGNRLQLDFSRVSRDHFERHRMAYQKNLQETFFSQYRIQSTYRYTIKRGESLWALALTKFKVPIWLLRQHNPDLDFNLMRAGLVITVPNLISTVSSADTR